ncbi:hypothetical protein ASD64_11370 [Mesorhizobium sp. Root157]|nr:hypothetical protein ASD64_11370 [Mesorhizobium sp. Root157]
MAVKWIAKRTPDAVRETWDAFRQRIGGDLKASIVLMDPDEGPLGAAQELLSRAASGAIQIIARRAIDDDIVTIPANEIPYLSLTFDGPPAFAARFEKGANGGSGTVVYRDMRVPSSDLKRVWPRLANPSLTKESPNAPAQEGTPHSHQQSPEVSSGAYMFLGQAVEWIICRGQPADSSHVAARLEAAERELFGFLDTENVTVEGYPINGRARVYESLPAGIWANMNRRYDSGLMFSSIDDTEEREDGGTVHVGDLQWNGVRLATSVVLKRWPPADAPTEQPKSIGRRPRYDWEAFDKVALAKLDEEGAFDPSVDTQWNKATFERYMATWCQNNWGNEPGESTIRSRLSEIEAAYLEGRKGQ